MMKRLLIFAVSALLFSQSSYANPERELIMSCTYGVLAGTLVGAALLAFEDDPDENLKQVARGASIGLYIGIGLGLYTAYILPNRLQKQEDQLLEDGIGKIKNSPPQFIVLPLISEKGVHGAGALWQVASF